MVVLEIFYKSIMICNELTSRRREKIMGIGLGCQHLQMADQKTG
jgi:hypothetical protein